MVQWNIMELISWVNDSMAHPKAVTSFVSEWISVFQEWVEYNDLIQMTLQHYFMMAIYIFLFVFFVLRVCVTSKI